MKLIYTGDFDTLERLGFKIEGQIRYFKESIYIGILNRMIFIPIDITGNSLGILYDLIKADLVEKVEDRDE